MNAAARCLAILLLAAAAAVAAVPDLRDQVSLNGSWTGGTVPSYTGISGLDTATYERQVPVPSSWSGKEIFVEFGAVNFIADVYVNGSHLLTHVGGWNPFAVDVTSKVGAGASFDLKVVVKGPNHSPIIDSGGKFQWPVGGWSNRGGIADDVWLRAYGKVHIEDAYIRTSWQKKTLEVRYTLRNSGSTSRTVSVRGDAARPGGAVEKTVTSSSVTIAPGASVEVTASGAWTSATPYWPDSPALYLLSSSLVENGATVDHETRRFGFREIWISGNQYLWNGVRINLYGDYQVYGDTYYPTGTGHTPSAWPTTVDRIKGMNIRCLRFHHNPVPQYVLDVADEKGLLICDEGANYGRDYLQTCNHSAYLANAEAWVGPWVRAQRNHPCVYIWNATNEMTPPYKCGSFDAGALAGLGTAIRKWDDMRPVGYDGDDTVVDVALNRHYPEGYNNEPSGSIYSWAGKVSSSKPTGAGETMHAKASTTDSTIQYHVERNQWWIGIWTRGMRATNWTDVRPACYWFAYADTQSSNALIRVRGENIRNAYDPVALFDKAYDDLGISPYVSGTTPGGTLPSLDEGSTQNRTLILYNDEFRDTAVTVDVEVRSGGKTYASSGATQFSVGLGSHIEIPCSFQVPNVGGAELQLVLTTSKGGSQRFQEQRRFTVKDLGRSGATSSKVTLTGGTAVAASGTGLSATYYDNQDFTGTTLKRIDPTIDFAWGSGSPASAIGADSFSARWQGSIVAPTSETYTFTTRSDDGVRLWVNGQKLIDHWTDHAATDDSATIALTAGAKVAIQLDYYENAAQAEIHLSWATPTRAKQIVPKSALFPAAATATESEFAAAATPDTAAPHSRCGLGGGVALLAGLSLLLRRQARKRCETNQPTQ